jgi:ABC-2 type transport system permease protein
LNRETIAEVALIARRSVRRTFRQPALIVPVVLFPLLLLAINASGLDVTKNIPNFPADSYLDFALVVTFMQGGLFAATTAGTELANDIETGVSTACS